MDFINSPQPLAPRCPKYLFPLDLHRISRRYFGISPDFRSIFTGDPTNRDILKGCRRLPQSGDLLRRVDNRGRKIGTRDRWNGQTFTQAYLAEDQYIICLNSIYEIFQINANILTLKVLR